MSLQDQEQERPPLHRRRRQSKQYATLKAGKAYRARDSFKAFRRLIHPNMHWNWMTEAVTIELQWFYEGFRDGKRPKLAIEMPPQHGKSLAVEDFIGWIAGKRPDWKTIFASYSEGMAKDTKEASSALIPDVGFVQTRGPLKHSGTPEKGNKRGVMGRPPGSVNKITREMREAVLAAADELGHIPLKDWRKEVNKKIKPEDDGIKQFYKMLAVKELRTFGVILARMMPTNVTHTTVAKLPTFMTEEEVIEGFREAGLPLELLDSMSMHDALTLTPEEYGTNPYDDPEADPIDVVPENKEPEPGEG